MAPIALFRSSATAGLLPNLRQLVRRFSSRTSLFNDLRFTEDEDTVYLWLDEQGGDERVRVALSPWAMLSVAEESKELAWFSIWLPALGVQVEELDVRGFKAAVKDRVVLVTLPKAKMDQSGIIRVPVK